MREAASLLMLMMDNKTLRVLFAGLTWPPETFIDRLIDGLIDRGFEITVATEQTPDARSDLGVKVKWLYAPAWGNQSKLNRMARLAQLSLKALAGGRSDCLKMTEHIRLGKGSAGKLRAWYRLLPFVGQRWDLIYFPWNSEAVAYLPLFDLGMPVLISCRGRQINVVPHNPASDDLRKKLEITFSKAAAIHCVSQAIQNEATLLGLDKKKSVIIRPAVDPFDFCPHERSRVNSKLTILSTGSLMWRKGFEYALLAVRELVQAGVDIHLDIIGEGSERVRLLYTIDDLNLAGSVRLLGRLSPAKVRESLQEADIFLLTSLSEGISNAVLEAMSCGVPVVTTDCGGMREAVSDGIEGFVVPVRNVQAAAALMTLATDTDLRRRMGAAARARVLKEFTLQRHVAEFAALCYRATINKP